MSQEQRPLLSDDDSDHPRDQHEQPTESSPLLGAQRAASQPNDDSDQARAGTRGDKSSTKRRWPSVIAIVTLALLVILVILVGFLVPPAVKEYAEQAVVIEPTDLSVESITQDGVRARIQGNFRLDGGRVRDENSRRIGRAVTGIMRKLQTEETRVVVSLPHYDHAMLGTAVIPPVTISLVDGHNTAIDIVADFMPGEADNIRKLVNDWLDGKLDQLKVTGSTDLRLKSGIFPLGTHNVVESMVFEGRSVYKSFSSLYFRQIGLA